MKKRSTLKVLFPIVLLTAGGFGQTGSPAPTKYLESRVAMVRPEKRSEFDEIVKKMADANRRHKGDTWLASEVAFGPGNVVSFLSARPNLAAIEEGDHAFMRALTETYGAAAAGKLLRDFDNCVISTQSEVWKMRPAVSVNAPADAAGMNKLLGESRWFWSDVEHVGPGHGGDYTEQLQKLKEAIEKTKSASYYTIFIGQSYAGDRSNTFLTTRFGASLETFEKGEPLLREVLGVEGARKYKDTNAALVLSAEIAISRFVPELQQSSGGDCRGGSRFLATEARSSSRQARRQGRQG